MSQTSAGASGKRRSVAMFSVVSLSSHPRQRLAASDCGFVRGVADLDRWVLPTVATPRRSGWGWTRLDTKARVTARRDRPARGGPPHPTPWPQSNDARESLATASEKICARPIFKTSCDCENWKPVTWPGGHQVRASTRRCPSGLGRTAGMDTTALSSSSAGAIALDSTTSATWAETRSNASARDAQA
jgi:hypothetical protein